MISVNATGLACPFPVIEAKKALRKSGSEDVVVRVDNEVAVNNLQRLADSMQRKHSLSKISDDLFELTIKGGKSESSEVKSQAGNESDNIFSQKKSEYIVQFGSKFMGSDNDELGAVLIKSFIYSLTEQDCLPVALVFYNRGVELTCAGSPVLEDLKTLEQAGTSIISCGTCLDFLKIKDKLALGEITNMYRIAELLRSYHTVCP